MLELRSVSWQNFLSYGDYPTTVELDRLGQCLIIGEVIDEDNDNSNPGQIRRSNGAGKSTIPSVIQWVLFGRTMHTGSRPPGNNIINWFSGKDCWGKIIFKNGDSITRTRNTDGKNELLISKDGDETKFVSDTLSTAANQQSQLNRLFGLDWEVFCGSAFFNQYGKPWMEMADATRKKAIERVLHVDRFSFYADAAKVKCDNLDKLVDKHRRAIESSRSNIEHLEQELTRLRVASDNFITNRSARANELIARSEREIAQRDTINLPDLDKLKERWSVVRQIEERLSTMRVESNTINSKIATINGNIQSLSSKIELWKQRTGKLCTSCEQTIPKDHTAAKIDPITDQLKSEQNKLTEFRSKQKAISETIQKVEETLLSRRPTLTIENAKSIQSRWKSHDTEAANLKATAAKVLKEDNPHETSIADVQKRIDTAKKESESAGTELNRLDLLNRHYHYVYKAYNDRNKIKSFIFRDHIPFINARLRHYLEVFDLDVKIELTDSLGISSNMWGYEFESGGERKRTDVAFMLAMFDFHEQMYGRQCNVLVLDEVDGRLDDDGIDALINIIKTDLAHRVETILVISHRNMMFDTFPKEMRVIRKDRFSTIELSI